MTTKQVDWLILIISTLTTNHLIHIYYYFNYTYLLLFQFNGLQIKRLLMEQFKRFFFSSIITLTDYCLLHRISQKQKRLGVTTIILVTKTLTGSTQGFILTGPNSFFPHLDFFWLSESDTNSNVTSPLLSLSLRFLFSSLRLLFLFHFSIYSLGLWRSHLLLARWRGTST